MGARPGTSAGAPFCGVASRPGEAGVQGAGRQRSLYSVTEADFGVLGFRVLEFRVLGFRV